jgi:hypothetical protein
MIFLCNVFADFKRAFCAMNKRQLLLFYFIISYFNYLINVYFHHNATQCCYSQFNLYSRRVSAVYGHHQVTALC